METRKKPKVAFVMTSVFMLKLLVPHIRRLSEDYLVYLLLKNDAPDILAGLDLPVKLIEIPIERKISLKADLMSLLAIWRFCKREKFDAVHTITPKAGLLGILASFAAKVPVRIHTFQGEIWANSKGMKRYFFRFLDKVVAYLTTHITVVSKSEKEFLVNEGVLAPDQGVVLGKGSIGGVDTKRFTSDLILRNKRRRELGFSETDLVFIYLGRVCADKGVLTLVDAFCNLLPKYDNIKLMIVGPDEEGIGDGVRKKFEARDSGRLTLLPFTNKPENEMIAGDVFVLPSLREGFGVVIIESAAMGIPSIGSDIYGIQDAISVDNTGLLFEMANSKSLTKQMQVLIESVDLRKRLGANARNRVLSCFKQDDILNEFVKFYSGVLDPNKNVEHQRIRKT